MTAADEGGLTVFDDFEITVTPVNDAPIVSAPLADQTANEDEAFSFAVPAGTFSDEETTSLTLTATQSDDSALPAWLTFDGTTFTGTPADGDGNVTVRVTAADEGGLTVFDDFEITVTPVNDAPTVDQGIDDQSIEGYEPFSFEVPANSFADEEDVLILSATNLPSFVTFDPETATFSGEAAINIDEGTYTITVTATEDNADLQNVSTTFDLEIVPVLSNEEELEEILVYPNPTENLLVTRLASDEIGEFEVQLFDRLGKVVISDSFVKNSEDLDYELDLTGMSPGIYMLRLTNGSSVKMFKVRKK